MTTDGSFGQRRMKRHGLSYPYTILICSTFRRLHSHFWCVWFWIGTGQLNMYLLANCQGLSTKLLNWSYLFRRFLHLRHYFFVKWQIASDDNSSTNINVYFLIRSEGDFRLDCRSYGDYPRKPTTYCWDRTQALMGFILRHWYSWPVEYSLHNITPFESRGSRKELVSWYTRKVSVYAYIYIYKGLHTYTTIRPAPLCSETTYPNG